MMMNDSKALLNPTPPVGEEARVTAVFKMAEEMIGFVPAGMRLYGISPPLLETFARTAGWADREIFDAVLQAASNRAFNFALKTFNVKSQDAFV
jgi:hypothetical protein